MSRSRIRALLLATVGLSFAASANASDYQGYVTSLIQIGSRVFIYVGNGHFGTDNCGTGRTQLILYTDPTTAEGRSFVALATTAKVTNTEVYVAGDGVCYTGNTPNGATSEALNVVWLQ